MKEKSFDVIADGLEEILSKYGSSYNYILEKGDFYIVQDDFGSDQIHSALVTFSLNKTIILKIQKLLFDFPSWEVQIGLGNGMEWLGHSLIGIRSSGWYPLKEGY